MSPAGLADLTRRWVSAWAVARGIELGEVEGWPLAHVATASRTLETVCCEPDPETWGRLLRWVGGDPSLMLTVVSGDPAPYVGALPSDVRIDRDDESLMTKELRTVVRAPVPSGFELDVDEHAGRVTVRLVDGDRVAVEGTVAVHGTDAAYDAVETTPRYRRQGLGSWVMHTLDARAREAGAHTGLLVATAEGAALYASLGWRRVAPMSSLSGS